MVRTRGGISSASRFPRGMLILQRALTNVNPPCINIDCNDNKVLSPIKNNVEGVSGPSHINNACDQIKESEEYNIDLELIVNESGGEGILVQCVEGNIILKNSNDEDPTIMFENGDGEDPSFSPENDDEENPSFILENDDEEDPSFIPEIDDEETTNSSSRVQRDEQDDDLVEIDSPQTPQNYDSEKSSLPDVNTPPRKRRRFADPNAWKRNIIKRKRLAGEAYLNRKRELVPAKQAILSDCNCRFKCRHAISIEQQKSLLEEYWSLKDPARQKQFLCSQIIQKNYVVRKRNRVVDSGCSKEVSRVYTLPNGAGENVRVCLKFFCNTFAISKRIPTDAMNGRSPNGTYIGRDKRVGRPASNATPQVRVREVLAFLAKFPKVPSHYCRQRSSCLYLAPDLTIEKMYHLYQEETGEQAVKANVFRKIFREHEPPLAIYVPKKDQCSLCNEVERTKEKNMKYEEHIQRKNDIKVMKELDKERAACKENKNTLVYGSFDLQAVLTLPFAGDCQIYYKRKLSLFNFTIFDSRNRGHCFLWDETNGKKGSAEISTSLLKYIDTLDPEVQHLVLYADTCGGQNRNKNVLASMFYAVNNSNLQLIDIKFMESGHSYLEADSIHATIERSRRSKKIYSTNEYKILIELSRKRPFPYNVQVLSFSDIYDIEDLTETLVQNRKKTIDGQSLNWLKVKWFRFEKGSGKVGFKYQVNDEFNYIKINPDEVKWHNISLKKKYHKRLEISLQKKRDLLTLLKQGVIPSEYSNFYNDLPSVKGKKDEAVWRNSSEDEELLDH